MKQYFKQKNLFQMALLLVMLFCGTVLLGQAVTVQGTVVDSSGMGLPGATVMIKGTTQGTTTDVDGNFQIQIERPTETILVFRYIGYQEQEILVGTQRIINVVLDDALTTLDEFVVIGYGTVRRRDITGSVASVSGEALAAKPVASVAQALTGKLAGVHVLTTEGSPDAEVRVRVRGGGSITGDNSPLFIVDGFPVESIDDISPADIETIDVLKDASSTAIYGSRGANGVIIITTRRGDGQRLVIRYDAFASFQRIANKLEVLSPYDYAKWQHESSLLSNQPHQYTNFFGNFQDMDLFREVTPNDWQHIVFGRTGHTINNNLSISGGSDRTNFAFSYSNNHNKAIMQFSGFKRDNLSLSVSNKPTDRITLDFSLRYSNTQINGGGANEQIEFSQSADARLRHAMLFPPFPVAGLTDIDETDSNFLLENPIEAMLDNDRFQKRLLYFIGGSLTWEILEGLRFKTELGYEDFRDSNDRFYGRSTFYVRNRPASEHQGLPAIIFTKGSRETFRNTNTLSFDLRNILPATHSMNLLVGQEYIFRQSEELENSVHGFPATFSFENAVALSAQAAANSVDNYLFPNDILLSFFGRVNYNYLGRYLFSATMRADGSSRFSRGNRWGYFPSAAFAWRISDESFMQFTKPWLEDLRIRLSYGTAGNNNIPMGQLLQSLDVVNTTWVNAFTSFWAPTKTMANPDLKWETTITRNVGIDYSFLRGRLTGSFEGYINNTENLLIRFPIPGTGYLDQFRNMGKTENRGVEAMLSYIAVDKRNFGLTISGNIGFNKNKIISLGQMNDFPAETGWASADIGTEFWLATGGSVGKMLGYRHAGRYTVDDFAGFVNGVWVLKEGVVNSSPVVGTLRPGSLKLIDVSGDGLVNISDRVIIGDANPLHTGGLALNARFHGFDLLAAFNWSYGNDIYNANKIEYTTTGRFHSRNMISIMEEGQRWTNLRPDGTISNDPEELAAMNANTTMWSPHMARFVFTDWAVEDGSFLRLNTLTLGYTLPRSFLNKVKIQRLRFYVTGSNVFLLTNYSGFDPEVSTRRRTPLTPGVDFSAYPRSRSLVFGMNLSF